MKKEQIAALLAPPAPPCFETRAMWVSYVASAAEDQRIPSQPGPFKYRRIEITEIFDPTAIPNPGVPSLIENGMLVTFDATFKFCADCEMAFKLRMAGAKRCFPNTLTEIEPS